MRALMILLLLMAQAMAQVGAPVGYGQPSTALESSRILGTGSRQLIGFQVNMTAAGWVMLFDSATVPADGPVTPVKWWQVAANSTLAVSWGADAPLLLLNGCTLVFSTTGPFTKTTSASATFSGEVR